jgi:hypothetical protein
VAGGELLHKEAVEPQRVRGGGTAPAPAPPDVDGAPQHGARTTRVSPAAVDAEGSYGDPHGWSAVLPGDPNR